MKLYEILKKYPNLHIEITYKHRSAAYIITLTYGQYTKKYYEPLDILEYFDGAVYISIIQDFFKENNIEVKI